MTSDELLARIRIIGDSGLPGRPVIVGPWLSEVGFELLYWIPFLRWAIEVAKIPRERVYVLSRGGCRSWYADITSNYLDLFDTYSPAQIIELNQRRITQQSQQGSLIGLGLRRRQRTAKQLYCSTVEHQIIGTMAKQAGIKQPAILHPSLLYNAFRDVWKRHKKRHLVSYWEGITRLQRLAVEPDIDALLPSRYVAVKFYASQACPKLPKYQQHVCAMVKALADSTDVVLLHTGTAYDEHGEFEIPAHPRIHRPVFTPTENLGQQSAIIAGADAFIGTYGGFAYLAPFLGVPTVACYGVDNFRHDHLGLMAAVAARLGVAFRVCPLDGGAAVIRGERQRWAHAA